MWSLWKHAFNFGSLSSSLLNWDRFSVSIPFIDRKTAITIRHQRIAHWRVGLRSSCFFSLSFVHFQFKFFFRFRKCNQKSRKSGYILHRFGIHIEVTYSLKQLCNACRVYSFLGWWAVRSNASIGFDLSFFPSVGCSFSIDLCSSMNKHEIVRCRQTESICCHTASLAKATFSVHSHSLF